MKFPDSVKRLIAELAALPSIGPRQATRLSFYLLGRGRSATQELASAITELQKIKICSRCYFIHEEAGALCDLCESPARNHSVIMVVEKETDLISLENTKKFNGQYFIVGPIPKIGVLNDYQKARLETLKTFIKNPPPGGLNGMAEEIILAFNPTTAGDFNANIVSQELSPLTNRLTRLGRGLPTGGEIEFADDDTLSGALEHRNN